MDRWSFYCQAMCSVQVCGMYAFAIWDKKNNTCPLSEAEWMFRLPKREECDVPEKRCFLGSLWLWQKNDLLANSAFKSSPVPHISRPETTLRGRQRILIAFFMRMMGWPFLTFHVLFIVWCFLSLFCDNETSEEHTVFPRFFTRAPAWEVRRGTWSSWNHSFVHWMAGVHDTTF